jgi:acid phosphatase (class A)
MIRVSLLAASAFVVLALGAPALGQAPAPAPKPAKVLRYLSPADIDPARLIPAPPADGSDANKAELAELHRLITARTNERFTQAQWDDEHEDWSMYAPVLGYNFDMDKLPATAEVMAILTDDASLAATAGKAKFNRKRPWAVDASIPTCDPDDKPLTSYPSGHATLGYSLGMTLAVMIPEKADVLMARADDYAFSRELCGAHYASDTRASQALAAAFVTALLKNPEFQAKVQAARTELRAAKIAG